jgi:hypothetical protein
VAFESHLDKQGIRHERASEYEDKAMGIDLWAYVGDRKVPYQIKSKGQCPDDLLGVELARLDGKYGSGWVFTTQAEQIVFDKGDHFLVIEARKLREAAERLVVKEETRHIEYAKWNYKMYARKSATRDGSREGKDLIMWIAVDDVGSIYVGKNKK